jgi:hypothetical protein
MFQGALAQSQDLDGRDEAILEKWVTARLKMPDALSTVDLNVE